ncbi:MAG: AMP-binding protein [Anaerolineales bacterium]|nr:AMP-binding protein [Anaerolineales bacterium]
MTTFFSRLQHLYETDPERTAIIWMHAREPEHPMTRRDLIRQAAGYAAALAAAGVRPGEVVILILQHSESLAAAFFGAVLHGAIPSIMPFLTEKLAPDSYRRSLKSLFEVTHPAAVVTYPEFAAELQDAIPAGGSVRSVLLSSEVAPVPEPDFPALRGSERLPGDVVLLQHSSGTTGLQKGVALSHEAVFRQLASYGKAIRLAPDDVVVSWLPLYHDMGLIAGFLMPLLSGIPLVLMSPFDWVRAPYKLMQAVSQHRGTLTWLPNFAFNFCAQKIRDRNLEGVDLASWRAVINCSEPMHYQSHRLFYERFRAHGLRESALATSYAMAENVFAVTQGGIDRAVTVDTISQRGLLIDRVARAAADGEETMRMLSCGAPLPNVEVRVVDDARGDLPERHLGEVMLRSDCMLTGYYRRDDLTEKAFHNGWYLTGDLGYMADGEVYITGRKKDLIIVGGKNVYPQDLESLASEVPGIHPGRVVAFGVYNEEMGTEEVVIVAEKDAEAEYPAGAGPEALSNEIRARVTRGSDIALRQVAVVERGWLLKTSSGKIARSANRDKFLAGKAVTAGG